MKQNPISGTTASYLWRHLSIHAGWQQLQENKSSASLAKTTSHPNSQVTPEVDPKYPAMTSQAMTQLRDNMDYLQSASLSTGSTAMPTSTTVSVSTCTQSPTVIGTVLRGDTSYHANVSGSARSLIQTSTPIPHENLAPTTTQSPYSISGAITTVPNATVTNSAQKSVPYNTDVPNSFALSSYSLPSTIGYSGTQSMHYYTSMPSAPSSNYQTSSFSSTPTTSAIAPYPSYSVPTLMQPTTVATTKMYASTSTYSNHSTPHANSETISLLSGILSFRFVDYLLLFQRKWFERILISILAVR